MSNPGAVPPTNPRPLHASQLQVAQNPEPFTPAREAGIEPGISNNAATLASSTEERNFRSLFKVGMTQGEVQQQIADLVVAKSMRKSQNWKQRLNNALENVNLLGVNSLADALASPHMQAKSVHEMIEGLKGAAKSVAQDYKPTNPYSDPNFRADGAGLDPTVVGQAKTQSDVQPSISASSAPAPYAAPHTAGITASHTAPAEKVFVEEKELAAFVAQQLEVFSKCSGEIVRATGYRNQLMNEDTGGKILEALWQGEQEHRKAAREALVPPQDKETTEESVGKASDKAPAPALGADNVGVAGTNPPVAEKDGTVNKKARPITVAEAEDNWRKTNDPTVADIGELPECYKLAANAIQYGVYVNQVKSRKYGKIADAVSGIGDQAAAGIDKCVEGLCNKITSYEEPETRKGKLKQGLGRVGAIAVTGLGAAAKGVVRLVQGGIWGLSRLGSQVVGGGARETFDTVHDSAATHETAHLVGGLDYKNMSEEHSGKLGDLGPGGGKSERRWYDWFKECIWGNTGACTIEADDKGGYNVTLNFNPSNLSESTLTGVRSINDLRHNLLKHCANNLESLYAAGQIGTVVDKATGKTKVRVCTIAENGDPKKGMFEPLHLVAAKELAIKMGKPITVEVGTGKDATKIVLSPRSMLDNSPMSKEEAEEFKQIAAVLKRNAKVSQAAGHGPYYGKNIRDEMQAAVGANAVMRGHADALGKACGDLRGEDLQTLQCFAFEIGYRETARQEKTRKLVSEQNLKLAENLQAGKLKKYTYRLVEDENKQPKMIVEVVKDAAGKEVRLGAANDSNYEQRIIQENERRRVARGGKEEVAPPVAPERVRADNDDEKSERAGPRPS